MRSLENRCGCSTAENGATESFATTQADTHGDQQIQAE